jgi:CrcB protein
MTALAIAVAGALGAVTRYGIAVAIGVRVFPWATLAINALGSFLLGWVLGAPRIATLSSSLTLAMTVGFLGSFTTFSTFAYEMVWLVRSGRPVAGLTYALTSVVLGGALAAGGYALGRAGG